VRIEWGSWRNKDSVIPEQKRGEKKNISKKGNQNVGRVTHEKKEGDAGERAGRGAVKVRADKKAGGSTRSIADAGTKPKKE